MTVVRTNAKGARAPREGKRPLGAQIMRHWQLYILWLLPMALLIIFKYMPMVGLQIAFRDYNFMDGIWNSKWRGLYHFANFFKSYEFPRLMRNTLVLAFYNLATIVPCAVVLALSINAARRKLLGRAAQFITYAPYFISGVIITTMVMQIFAMRGGLFNTFRAFLGLEAVNVMASPAAFPHIFAWTNVWYQNGYQAVFFLAALAGINPELYEAAKIDGAGIWHRIIHIDIPGIMPTVATIFILKCGEVFKVSTDMVLLLQNPLNMDTADVINTYVYRIGISSAQYSYSSAIGFFNSVIALILILIADQLSRKYSETSLFY
jgi:putative aldouronate transport system permease protein